MTDLARLAEAYRDIPYLLAEIAESNPGARVIRNQVGNLAILRADDSYLGYIDVLAGDVVAVNADPEPS